MNTPITSYSEACSYLDDLQMHKIKLGLDAMRETLAELGSPETVCPAVHVAGTNGKGSVCSMLRTTATMAGYRTGIYTSPHLDSVRERFRIDKDAHTVRASYGHSLPEPVVYEPGNHCRRTRRVIGVISIDKYVDICLNICKHPANHIPLALQRLVSNNRACR